MPKTRPQATQTISKERVKRLNNCEACAGPYVLYWMEQSQRATKNHALEYAIQQANRQDERLLVVFALRENDPDASRRRYRFLLEGLRDVATGLRKRGIPFVVERGEPDAVALEYSHDASLVVCDRGYLRPQREWRERVAANAERLVVQVESDAVVPVETASNKAEYAARTLRPRLQKQLDRFLFDLRTTPLKRDSLSLAGGGVELDDLESLLDSLRLGEPDRVVEAAGGTNAAVRTLRRFCEQRLARYHANRNQPQTDDVSELSRYLHFGQISPLQVALQVQHSGPPGDENRQAFVEELIVRRELACNFTQFTPNYDSYDCLPEWARKTLDRHRNDRRDYLYSREELEAAETHDPYFNAAMREMRYAGFMHNYMRMYWGKKILEWSRSPEEAFETALTLNNKYFLDGCDPNSYAGVAWVFGMHDRPWGERPIIGTVRSMTAAGLERKCDIDGYVRKVEQLARPNAGSHR